MIGKTLAHYQVLDKLGAGGMGEVYRARDTRLNRDVAIKVLPPIFAQDRERMARFEREAQLLAQLNHPCIAAIYGLEESDTQRFLVLEYVPGETLRGPLPPADALPIVHQIIDALEEAHEKGIVHRDLKPANIKITPDGKVKVLDFGLAKALSDDPVGQVSSHSPTLTALAVTRGGMLLGTAAYMSPEQARGKTVDKRTDIFAFGSVLYEMLTGKQAFGGETISDSLAAILTKEPDRSLLPTDASLNLRTLLDRCLQKEPKKRLRDIGEARIILDAAEEFPQPLSPAPQPPPRRPIAWIAAVVLLAVALAGVAVVHFRETPLEAPASRFEIPAPQKTSFLNAPSLSPNGRQIAFVATIPDGRQLLWVRGLDSLEARALPGTEGALFPFWSPDSRFIGFTVPGKLKRIEAAGGPPQALCDVAPFALGGAWNRDGVIIFGAPGMSLKRVPAAGGSPSDVTTADPSQPVTHMWPQFLPDGRHFLYTVGLEQADKGGIHVASLDSPKEGKRLVASIYQAGYAPGRKDGAGHLLFVRDTTLMAQLFDERRLELGGEAFPVAERVGVYRSGAFFSVSPSGSLAYRGGGGRLTQLAWFDRNGKQLQAVGAPGEYNDLALSPDNTRVVASRREPQGVNRDLWLIDLARNGSISRFTFHPMSDEWPAWSPDGTRVVFSSLRDGAPNLYQKAASGAGSDEPLLKPGPPRIASDWSPDGRHILFSSAGAKTRIDLWIVPVEGDRKPAPYLQSEFDETQGQFAPDGKFVAYASNESGTYEIYVQAFPASGAKWMVSAGGGVQPRWRRDGKEIFYLTPTNKIMAVEVRTTPAFEAAVPKPLFESRIVAGEGFISFRFASSADGKRFLINTALEETASAPTTLVLNWQSGIKR